CYFFGFSFYFFFFFSSRRRHTRFDCDWSSDVCSSDLRHRHDVRVRRRWLRKWQHNPCRDRSPTLFYVRRASILDQVRPLRKKGRSEERRVGKECRSQWWRYHKKKKDTTRMTG